VTAGAARSLPDLDVSRETRTRLLILEEQVKKWNKAINLVSQSSILDLFERHIVDSAQLYQLVGPDHQTWADLGSGGGFPGLVIACLAVEHSPTMSMTLVESDQRKAAFLRQASYMLGLSVTVIAERIEITPPIHADVVSARALAPLPRLCGYVHRHLRQGGMALLHKGTNHLSELEEAQRHWRFRLTRIESSTDPTAVILKLEDLTHV
jgi:16S rRNA (guanine527-N7)-methyltransferase